MNELERKVVKMWTEHREAELERRGEHLLRLQRRYSSSKARLALSTAGLACLVSAGAYLWLGVYDWRPMVLGWASVFLEMWSMRVEMRAMR